ncbi:MAG: pyridoxamine 5'-phosphate oxidase family protein [Gammaproteobacteria bacterium]|nr:pyridoxamine 5'-phosphate oxidase family protein [Gammaproteobacteria bacterium]
MPAADHYNNLDAAFARTWQELALGGNALIRRHGFRVIQLATTAADGAPGVRSVVLRAVAAATGQLQFHTDSRSHKVTEIAAQPRVALHADDARRKLQLRLLGKPPAGNSGTPLPRPPGRPARRRAASRPSHPAGARRSDRRSGMPSRMPCRSPLRTLAHRNFMVVSVTIDLARMAVPGGRGPSRCPLAAQRGQR